MRNPRDNSGNLGNSSIPINEVVLFGDLGDRAIFGTCGIDAKDTTVATRILQTSSDSNQYFIPKEVTFFINYQTGTKSNFKVRIGTGQDFTDILDTTEITIQSALTTQTVQIPAGIVVSASTSVYVVVDTASSSTDESVLITLSGFYVKVAGNPNNVEQLYIVTTGPNPPNTGTVAINIKGTYFPIGATIVLTGTAAEGYNFSNWQGDGITILNQGDNPITVIVTGTMDIDCVFEAE